MIPPIGKNARITPPGSERFLQRVHLKQGSQVLRIPNKSHIYHMTLSGGASHHSDWAALRGAVLKFAPNRDPVFINGNEYKIPSGHTLMDKGSYQWTIQDKHDGKDIPHQLVRGLSPAEKFYLTHAGYCHPNALFLPQGKFTRTQFFSRDILGIHMQMSGRTLFVDERRLEYSEQSINILTGLSKTPQSIKVKLAEGGHLTLTNR